jgi:hypothetical protein
MLRTIAVAAIAFANISDPRFGPVIAVALDSGRGYVQGSRLDPVKARVALPAADPPDNAFA